MFLLYYYLIKYRLNTLNALSITTSYKFINVQTKKLQKLYKRILQIVVKGIKNRIVIWDNLYRVNNV